MDSYRTIDCTSEGEYEEKRSKFIAHLAHTSSEEEACAFIAAVKAENRTARHNVYAYILRAGNSRRYSDDSEPQGTAGIPVLKVLEGAGLTDVCCVVTRYFGGILLGTGGLARAYTEAAANAVANASVAHMVPCRLITFSCPYHLYGNVTNAMAGFQVKKQSEDFGENVTLELLCTDEDTQGFTRALTELSSGGIHFDIGDIIFADMGEGKQ